VLAAIPVKRRIINIEQLPFPSAVATAEHWRSLHAGRRSDRAGATAPRVESGGGCRDRLARPSARAGSGCISPHRSISRSRLAGYAAHRCDARARRQLSWLFGAALSWDWRTAWSMLLGAVIAYGVLAPRCWPVVSFAVVEYRAICASDSVARAGLLVGSGVRLCSFKTRPLDTHSKAFHSWFAKRLRGARRFRPPRTPLASRSAPRGGSRSGSRSIGPVVDLLQHTLFAVPWWRRLSRSRSRSSWPLSRRESPGETDITPTKALGPVTQLLYGCGAPRPCGRHVMGANVTGGYRGCTLPIC